MTERGLRPSDARFGARTVLAGLALALVAVPFGLLLFLVKERWSPLVDVDQGARDALGDYAAGHDGFVSALKVLEVVGSAVVYLPLFALVAAWLVWQRLPRLALFVAVTLGLSPLLNRLVKALVDRTRPALPDPVARAEGLSFPSGHAQSSVVAASVLLLVLLPLLHGRRRTFALVLAAGWVLAIGFSRVALGVHYVTDVLAGYVLGTAWVAAMTAAFRAWRRERGRPAAGASDGLEPERLARANGRAPGRPDSARARR